MLKILLTLSFLLPMPALSQTLASLVDKNRVLLVFAPTDHDPNLQQQLTLLHHRTADMRDRDLVLIPILAQSGPPTTPNTLRTLHPPLISDKEQLLIRNRFAVPPPEFAVILLGKDGGEKLRSPTPIPIDRINQTIDAMPMRKQEIRDRAPK